MIARVAVEASDERSPTDSPELVVDCGRWAALAQAALEDRGAAGSLSLWFVDVDEIARLNAEHMGVAGPTDVLSFPLDVDETSVGDVPVLLGDVVVSPSVAGEQFAGHAGSYDDEIALLVIHGVLHVLGHDHAEPEETAVMRSLELELLEAHHWQASAPPGFRHDHADS
ncbi:MAG: rRNA maturation RNase YbeY [Actinomycetota bacterium]